MKYIYNINYSEAIKDITAEGFNLEAGKQYYQNGKLIHNNKKLLPYPTFTIDNISVTIKASMAFIFVPNKIMGVFCKNFKTSIIAASDQFKTMYGFDHLQTYSSLEINSDHFTLLKSKHNIEGCLTSNPNFENSKRRIFVNENNDKLDKIIGLSRFTWVIYSIEQFMDDLVNWHSRKIPISCQLISIFYDPDKLLNLENGELRISNLTFREFNLCNKLLNVCSYGSLDDHFVDKYKDTEPHQNFEIFELMQTINLESDKPEFLAGWYDTDLSIALCEKRKAGFEIIRQLGDFSIYAGNSTILMEKVNQPIYLVDYQDINTGDRCAKCNTPLHGDIYIICPDKKSNTGIPYCPICLHSSFDSETSKYHPDGILLYTTDDIIVRTSYPTTTKQIIDSLPIDDVVKDIIYQSYQPLCIESYYNSKAIYINHANLTSQKKYIGWNGDINQYISYAYDNSTNHHIPANQFLNHLQSCYLFKYNYISYF